MTASPVTLGWRAPLGPIERAGWRGHLPAIVWRTCPSCLGAGSALMRYGHGYARRYCAWCFGSGQVWDVYPEPRWAD
jgi:hypothetical protein